MMKLLNRRPAIALPLIAILLSFDANTQALKAGDAVPQVKLAAMDQAGDFTFASLNKKLVILQFWNTMCKSCIGSFPKADSLQKKYRESVEFVFVSKESRSEVEDFFRLRKKIKKPLARFIAGDTVLHRLFPHQFVPHHVWLKDGRTVLAITLGQNTSDKKIGAYLSSATADLPPVVKQSSYDWRKPAATIQIDSDRLPFGYFSYLAPPIDSVYGTISYQKIAGSKSHNRVIANKASFLNLLLSAFNENSKKNFAYKGNNVIVDIKRNQSLLPPSEISLEEEWSRGHTFLYDLMVPPSRSGELYRFMQEDIQRLFRVKATIENKKADCMCIVVKGDTSLLTSKGGTPKNGKTDYKDDTMIHFRNITMKQFMQRLGLFSSYAAIPLADETSLKGKIDIDVSRSLFLKFDYDILAANLSKYGLGLTKNACITEMLVIKDDD